MNSMTGYGKCVVERENRTVTIEMKSVNNRYLEINCRMPKALAFLEEEVKKVIKSKLSRGTVDVFFNYENNAESSKVITVDHALASRYVEVAQQLADKYAISNDYGVNDLMRTADVLKVETASDDEQLIKSITVDCVAGATDALKNMRAIEGETIKADLTTLVDHIDEALAKAELRAPKVVTEYAEKIRARITELLSGVEIDEARLVNEVAFFADKADINEEISRLHSHIAQYRNALASDGPQGRNLDFIAQEMGREINTMGSKSNDSELTALVIYMKNELEKIKEQIRNVE